MEIQNVEVLRDSLLKAIKPMLKSPTTAILCDADELTITELNGVYSIEGYVSSQNGYGAMIKNDFSAKAVKNSDGLWVISNTTVGVKTAVAETKSFAVNYIAISIVVGVLALIGLLFDMLVVGLI